jgi:hypothetical protein
MKDLFMIFAAVILGVVGQVSLKKGMLLSGSAGLTLSLIKVIFTPYIFLGLVLYGLAMFLWLSILSRVELSYFCISVKGCHIDQREISCIL